MTVEKVRALARDLDEVMRKHRAGPDVLLAALAHEVATSCLSAATVAFLQAQQEPTQAGVLTETRKLLTAFVGQVRAVFAEADVSATVEGARSKYVRKRAH